MGGANAPFLGMAAIPPAFGIGDVTSYEAGRAHIVLYVYAATNCAESSSAGWQNAA